MLKTLTSESVDCVVTSPPYFGLRDYGVEGQCGLEPTPDAFVANLVEVFREVRRVLRAEGTLWLNLGDSYAGSGKGGNPPDSPFQKQATNAGSLTVKGKRLPRGEGRWGGGNLPATEGLKPKDLIGIPWLTAFALRADGWWLRQDIIWAKPNPMPESVTDRCTKSHEHLFLFSKSATYHFDAAAIAEPSVYAPGATAEIERAKGYYGGKWSAQNASSRNDTSFKAIRETRNKRDVWTITTKPFAEAHFATFPPDLVEPCVLAGCPEGGTVLDPFAGAGTVGLVADRLDRDSVLIELNPLYVEMAQRRLVADRERRASIQPALTLSDL